MVVLGGVVLDVAVLGGVVLLVAVQKVPGDERVALGGETFGDVDLDDVVQVAFVGGLGLHLEDLGTVEGGEGSQILVEVPSSWTGCRC